MSGDGDDGGGTWVVEVDESSFGNEVLASDVPVVLDCYADWCGPCRQLTPVLEEIVRGAAGRPAARRSRAHARCRRRRRAAS